MGTRLTLEEQDPSALPLSEAPRVEFLRLPGQAQASGRRMALVSPESVLGCRLGLRLMEDGMLPGPASCTGLEGAQLADTY